jgi:hypothetical protein
LPRTEPGAVSISLHVLEAAAEEPLIESPEGLAVFDEDSFRRRLLANTEPDAHA